MSAKETKEVKESKTTSKQKKESKFVVAKNMKEVINAYNAGKLVRKVRQGMSVVYRIYE